jgi:monoamine oxidase
MVRPQPEQIVVIGAGAAGLMAARELGRAGKRVTILEARNRCGGRIHSLPEFGYAAEGGAEFVHGEAPVTRSLLREAGLSQLPIQGVRWNVENGDLAREEPTDHHTGRLYQVLAELKSDMTVAEFLQQRFAGSEYSRLRRSVVRMVEGYDAADPDRASILAVRDEWMGRGTEPQTRIVGGYGALIDFLAAECRRLGIAIQLNAIVSAIEASDGRALVHCADGNRHESEAAILTVPLPLLHEIALPPAVREKAAAAAAIGFGNVIKILLRFKTRWWVDAKGKDLSDLLFLLSDQTIPVWWTQQPTDQPVLTGWLAGPKTKAVASLDEGDLIETGLTSLACILDVSPKRLTQDLVAARAINWEKDPFARGAYSYTTPETRMAQSTLASPAGAAILFSGEAFYRGRDMGTVEAALASGLETARTILTRNSIAAPCTQSTNTEA